MIKKLFLAFFLSFLLLPALQAAQTCTTTQIGNNNIDFKGISGSSDSNVIAVGEKGNIYTYNGSSWSGPLSIPGNPNNTLEDIAVINSNSSVSVGKNGTVILQNNGTWSTLTPPTGEDLKAVWAYSVSDFYVFGKNGTIFHYNGSSWTDLSGPAGTGNNDDFEDAWGNSTYVYGLTKKGKLFRLTRATGAWTTITTCAAAANDDLKSLWGDANGNLYLAGKKGGIYKYTASTGACAKVATASQDLEGIYGSTTTGEIYAVGKNGVVMYFNGSSWVSTTTGTQDLKAVWVSSAGNAYYAAKNGFASTCTYTANPNTPTCSTTTLNNKIDFKGVSGSSDSNVIAVGEKGNIYTYNGSSWSGPVTVPGNPNEKLEDVAVISSNSSVSVGKNGTVILQNNGTWSTLTPPTGEDLKAVWAYSVSDFYVFGKNGTIFHYNGSSWTDLSGPAGTGNNDDFEDAWGNSTYVYGLTKKGKLFRLTRATGAWTTITTCAAAANDDLKSLWGDANGNLYLAGKKGGIYKYTASTGACAKVATASQDLEGIYGSTTTGEIYAVGKNGVVMYFNGTSWSESTVGTQDLKAVWVSSTGKPYYAGKNGTITICTYPTTLHHIEFVHDGLALTCTPEAITVKACSDASCSSLLTSSVAVTLTPSGWVGGNSKTFTGSASYNLQFTSPGTVTLGVSSSTPSASNAVVCKDSAGNVTSCDIVYKDSGFIFNVGTQTSCQTSPNITISAVRKDLTTQQCVPFFNGKTATVKFWNAYANPSTGTRQAILNYNATNYTLPVTSPGIDVPVTFDSNGQATFTLTYNDAGQTNLNASYTGSSATGDAGLIMNGNKLYVTKPAKLYVFSDDANAACPSADPANTNCSTAFRKTGQNFNLKIRGACADNSVTPNFQLTGLTLSSNLVAPTSAGSVNATPAVTGFDITAADNGEHVISNQNVNEVGVFTFTAAIPATGYLGETVIGSTTLNTSANIGRFTPDHFETLVTHGCSGGATFTYSGQPFSVTTYARNHLNNTTVNYRDAFAFGTNLSDAATPATANGVFSNNSITAFTAGVGTQSSLRYTFNNKETEPYSLAIRATDITDTALSSSGFTEGASEIRSGRTFVENSFGSELIDMPVSAGVQYYTSNGFVTNTADSCTTIDVTLTDIGTDPVTLGTGNGQTCIWDDANNSVGTNDYTCLANAAKPQFSEPPSNGSFNIYLKAPGATFTGDISVILNSPNWLQFDWDGNGVHDNNPNGTASFGVYRGDDRIIHWREVF